MAHASPVAAHAASMKHYRFFNGVQVADAALRAAALEAVLDQLASLEAASPSLRAMQGMHEGDVGATGEGGSEQSEPTLLDLLPTIVRVMAECPFPDVTASLRAFLDHVEEDLGIPLPAIPAPSAFAPRAVVPHPHSSTGAVAELFEASFVRFGRVSHFMQVLGMHPSYLELFSTTVHHVMYAPGPLPRTWRAYLAAMAGAQARCPYIVRRQLQAFVADGGDSAWLAGLAFVPAKLAKLARLNALLMLRPWEITSTVLGELLHEGFMSVGELVHAIVVLTTYHSIASLVWGMGVQPEVDWHVQQSLAPPSAPPPQTPTPRPGKQSKAPSADVEASPLDPPVQYHTRLMALPGSILDAQAHGGAAEGEPSAPAPQSSPAAECSAEAVPGTPMPALATGHDDLKARLVSAAEGGDAGDEEEAAAAAATPTTPQQEGEGSGYTSFAARAAMRKATGAADAAQAGSEPAPAPEAAPAHQPGGAGTHAAMPADDGSWRKRLTEAKVAYRDFHIREGVARLRDFSWQEHGFPMLSRFYPSVTPLLDSLALHTFTLTYNTLGLDEGLDTTPYRTAVWYMVQRLFGMTNDDYSYANVNKFLEVPTKRYIKRAVTQPWLLEPMDFLSIVGGMTYAERCHVDLLAVEAKKQCVMLYVLRALGAHFT